VLDRSVSTLVPFADMPNHDNAAAPANFAVRAFSNQETVFFQGRCLGGKRSPHFHIFIGKLLD